MIDLESCLESRSLSNLAEGVLSERMHYTQTGQVPYLPSFHSFEDGVDECFLVCLASSAWPEDVFMKQEHICGDWL